MAVHGPADQRGAPADAQVQTERLGDVHHYAWRACHRNQTAYINERDGERFGDWEPQQCAVRNYSTPNNWNGDVHGCTMRS